MALIAEVNGLFMHHVTVGAIQLILIMRRNVGVVGLYVLGFFDECGRRVTLSAFLNRRDFRVGHVHILTMAHLTTDASGNVPICTELSS